MCKLKGILLLLFSQQFYIYIYIFFSMFVKKSGLECFLLGNSITVFLDFWNFIFFSYIYFSNFVHLKQN